ncbi:nucleoside-diphosphate sugar epimerase/dehydratase [Paenibacillus sp. JMULE4]|uniref:UDP-N-acetylglucosamine 4,6-dehydratase family protein n=1 Tax=Paenibacillus sp. JMULE4 TaxID=2518342 RepID=UPI0020C65790|nr:nucleoside-diphosphate sugar epimerase/dehydratase [Paenibacillus sp. JMULE4]
MNDVINGKVSINTIRNVSVEDLLGREPVKMNLEEIAGYLADKVVMVTGAGGSIGSELCRQIAYYKPKSLLLLGHGENSIYEIELELKKDYASIEIYAIIADIQDRDRIRQVFEEFRPQVVFHAAAHKHVPLMERNPIEAIKNNVFGTKNVADASDEFGVSRFVMISTDKAVNPTNVMGATKRIAEMIIQALDKQSKTQFAAVRFGNVLGSRGSVIPIFKKQIEEGRDVTITHPDMIRYFMTIPEAVQLVIQTGSLANGGEIFILDMGRPVKIADLASDLIRLSGLEPGKDINIVYTGIRPGEKLFEEILSNEEGAIATKHDRIYR